jgi:hypothetical protein
MLVKSIATTLTAACLLTISAAVNAETPVSHTPSPPPSTDRVTLEYVSGPWFAFPVPVNSYRFGPSGAQLPLEDKVPVGAGAGRLTVMANFDAYKQLGTFYDASYHEHPFPALKLVFRKRNGALDAVYTMKDVHVDSIDISHLAPVEDTGAWFSYASITVEYFRQKAPRPAQPPRAKDQPAAPTALPHA